MFLNIAYKLPLHVVVVDGEHGRMIKTEVNLFTSFPLAPLRAIGGQSKVYPIKAISRGYVNVNRQGSIKRNKLRSLPYLS